MGDLSDEVRSIRPISVSLSDSNSTLEGYINVTMKTNPDTYDSDGAAMYIVAVILVYGLSIVFFIGSLAKRNKKDKARDIDEGQVSQYLNDVPNLKERTQRDKYKELKCNIVRIVNKSKQADPEFGLTIPTSEEEGIDEPDSTILPKHGSLDLIWLPIGQTVKQAAKGKRHSSKASTILGTNKTSVCSPDLKAVHFQSNALCSPNNSQLNSVKESVSSTPIAITDIGRQKLPTPPLSPVISEMVPLINTKEHEISKTKRKKHKVRITDTTLQYSNTASWGETRIYERLNSDPLAKSGSSGYHSIAALPIESPTDSVQDWVLKSYPAFSVTDNTKRNQDNDKSEKQRSSSSVGFNLKNDSIEQHSIASSQTDVPISAYTYSCQGRKTDKTDTSIDNKDSRQIKESISSHKTPKLSLSFDDHSDSENISMKDLSTKHKKHSKHDQGEPSNKFSSKLLGCRSARRLSNTNIGNHCYSDLRNLQSASPKSVPKNSVENASISSGQDILEMQRNSILLENKNEKKPSPGVHRASLIKATVSELPSPLILAANGGVCKASNPTAQVQTYTSDDLVDSKNITQRLANENMQYHKPAHGLSPINSRTSTRSLSLPVPSIPNGSALSVQKRYANDRRANFVSQSQDKPIVLRSLDKNCGESYGPYSRTDVCYNSQYVPAFFESSSSSEEVEPDDYRADYYQDY